MVAKLPATFVRIDERLKATVLQFVYRFADFGFGQLVFELIKLLAKLRIDFVRHRCAEAADRKWIEPGDRS